MKTKDLQKVGKVVLISAIILVLVGVVEIVMGSFTNSVGLVADGIDSMSDSVISFMVWFGLRISRRQADKKFHFGYYRVETLVSLIIAILMIIMSLSIFYTAYSRIINPLEINYPTLGIITLVFGGIISLGLSIIKNRLAKKYNLLSLKADAKASIKDWTSSFVILAGFFLSYLGFKWGDALGALIVGAYIILIAITTIKNASLILIDGFNNPELVKDISTIIRKYPKVKLKELKLRMTGPYITGEISVTVDPNMSVGKVYDINNKIEEEIMKKVAGVKNLTILAEPEGV